MPVLFSNSAVAPFAGWRGTSRLALGYHSAIIGSDLVEEGWIWWIHEPWDSLDLARTDLQGHGMTTLPHALSGQAETCDLAGLSDHGVHLTIT